MLNSQIYGSDEKIIFPDSWAHRGPVGVNDPGYGWNADGTLAWEIIGNHPDPAKCDGFYKKSYTFLNGVISSESGWVKQ